MILLKMLKIQICNIFKTKLNPNSYYYVEGRIHLLLCKYLMIFSILKQIVFYIARKDNSSIQYNCILYTPLLQVVSFWPSLDGLPKYCFRMRPHVHPFQDKCEERKPLELLKWEPDDGMKTGNDYRKLGGKMRELTRIIKIQTTTIYYTSGLDVNDVGVCIVYVLIQVHSTT